MAQRVIIDFSDEARARKVISRSNHRVTGKYPGLKSRRMHHWESLLEQDAFRRLDANPEVVTFAEQPAKLLYRDGAGATRTHYPDILVTAARGREFVEVKYDDDAASAEVAERTALLEPALAQQGYGYRLWCESSIRRHSHIPNIRFLLRVGRHPVPIERFERMRRQFDASPTLSWYAITAPIRGRFAIGDAARLVLDGRLRIDLDQPIGDDTPVTFMAGGTS